jgi:hypothetical protein
MRFPPVVLLEALSLRDCLEQTGPPMCALFRMIHAFVSNHWAYPDLFWCHCLRIG